MAVIYRINGRKVTKAEWDKRRGVGLKPGEAPRVPNTYRSDAPHVTQGAGCLPHQVPAMREFCRKKGVRGVVVNNDGTVECRTRGARRRLLKARSLHDNDGGFGDG
jgi:hypothetical protein